MSFSRPTLAELISSTASDLQTRVTGLEVRLRRTFEAALAYCLAALAHGLYGHLFYLSQQLLPTAPSGEQTVRAWGEMLELPPKDPSFASGNLNFTGTPSTPIPQGTVFQRTDGVEFATTAALTIGGGGSVTGEVKAVASGDAGNTDAGVILTIVTPIAGVTQTASVDGDGLTGGADAEELEDYRARVLARLGTPPTGGGPGDYVQWALQVPGVTRAWEYPGEQGAGTVVVRFATDNDVSPIPNPAKVAEVQAYLDSVAPIAADVIVVAPVEYTLDMTIDLTPDTTAVRAAVTTELEGYLRRSAEPAGSGGGTLLKSQLDEAVSLAAGETDHTISVPAGNVSLTTGQLPVLGTITWV